MGHIAEPKGIDFIIDSTTLTEEDQKMISIYVENRKAELGLTKPKANQAKKKAFSNDN